MKCCHRGKRKKAKKRKGRTERRGFNPRLSSDSKSTHGRRKKREAHTHLHFPREKSGERLSSPPQRSFRSRSVCHGKRAGGGGNPLSTRVFFLEEGKGRVGVGGANKNPQVLAVQFPTKISAHSYQAPRRAFWGSSWRVFFEFGIPSLISPKIQEIFLSMKGRVLKTFRFAPSVT